MVTQKPNTCRFQQNNFIVTQKPNTCRFPCFASDFYRFLNDLVLTFSTIRADKFIWFQTHTDSDFDKEKIWL